MGRARRLIHFCLYSAFRWWPCFSAGVHAASGSPQTAAVSTDAQRSPAELLHAASQQLARCHASDHRQPGVRPAVGPRSRVSRRSSVRQQRFLGPPAASACPPYPTQGLAPASSPHVTHGSQLQHSMHTGRNLAFLHAADRLAAAAACTDTACLRLLSTWSMRRHQESKCRVSQSAQPQLPVMTY